MIEGDNESEQILNTMLVVDNRNLVYNIDYNKFLQSMNGSGIVPTSNTTGAPTVQGPTPGYYWEYNLKIIIN